MKKDGSSLVRRQLDFREKILTKTTFYIDIREDDLKKRISRRIRDLGGQVEGFLSKDVHILLTDSNNTSQKIGPSASLTPSPDPETKITVPLSRGEHMKLNLWNTYFKNQKAIHVKFN
ncbi:Protein DBF4-like A [Mizuhopecten yessoensis]|uniref:Protein DBF4-like A n=1 Tax=Mizuhopecten yessoensis TaxID=6573 RepID=A0A210PE95_MIZYE|nr:Protein DBF4-like A [Mizuhopecten yessoensis]